jgi:hypothetical protein
VEGEQRRVGAIDAEFHGPGALQVVGRAVAHLDLFDGAGRALERDLKAEGWVDIEVP